MSECNRYTQFWPLKALSQQGERLLWLFWKYFVLVTLEDEMMVHSGCSAFLFLGALARIRMEGSWVVGDF